MHKFKKKDIGLIALAITIFIIVIITLVQLNKPKTPSNNIELPEDTIKIADTMIVPNKDGLNLVNIDGTILDKIENATLFKVSDNSDEYMYFKDNALFTSSIDIKQDENNNDVYSFVENKVLDVENVNQYIFNDDYIVLLTESELQENTNDSIDKKEEVNETKEDKTNEDENVSNLVEKVEVVSNSKYYDVSIIDRNTKQEISKIEHIQIDDSILFNKNFVYSISNTVYMFNFDTKETKELYLGKVVSDLRIVDNNLIIFDKFGNGQGKSLILQVNDDFSINKAIKHDAPDIIEIETLKEENDIYFVEMDDTPLLYKLNLSEEKEQRNKENLNIEIDGRYSDDNTMYAKGYIYTAASNKITLLDLKSATIYKTYDIDADFVYPVFLEK